MKTYYVEGLFIPRKNLNKKSGSSLPSRGAEPFARSFRAEDQAEALRLATEALEGGRWLETPRVSLTSEEKRMRQAGAPELPGFSSASSGKKAKPPARR